MNLPLCLCLLFTLQSIDALKRVCYISIDHPPFDDPSFGGFAEFLRAGYRVEYCTHINIFPFFVANDSHVLLGDHRQVEMMRELVALKKSDPQLKLLLSIAPSAQLMSQIASSVSSSSRLFESILEVIVNHGPLDGVDIDWEFPVYSTHNPADRGNFVQLLRNLRAFFRDKHHEHLLITAAVAIDPTIILPAYDIPALDSLLDYVNLMTYDFLDYHWFYPFLSLNAPFKPYSRLPYFRRLNVVSAVDHWLAGGLRRHKLILGVPTYGHSFLLANPRWTDPPALAREQGPSVGFADACLLLQQSDSSRVFHESARVPYVFNRTHWISYEDTQSLLEKVVWLKEQRFGGVMTFNLNNDDYSARCGLGPFPLHRLIHQQLTASPLATRPSSDKSMHLHQIQINRNTPPHDD